MTLSRAEALARFEGDLEELYRSALFDGLSPGVCRECGALADDVEPDCRRGYCYSCEALAVASVCILGGVI